MESRRSFAASPAEPSSSSAITKLPSYHQVPMENSANKWNKLLTNLATLCARLIENEGLQRTTNKTIANGFGKDSQETACLIGRLRELTASVDCQLLKFKPVDSRRMWADSFFTPVFEHRDLFEMSIFGFRYKGHRIPLHDHPKMFGFVRPLHGRIRLSSYTWLNPDEEGKLLAEQHTGSGRAIRANREPGSLLRPAKYEGQQILSTPPEGCEAPKVAMLEPEKANLHSIEALDDGAAFFDLLVPGYHSENRTCTYYTVVSDEEPAIGDIVWLESYEDTPEHFTMQRV